MCIAPPMLCVMRLLLSVLQEESCVKPEEPGPRSRFGPSTEDLTNASKQVWTHHIDMWGSCARFILQASLSLLQWAGWLLLFFLMFISVISPLGRLSQSGATETSPQEVPPREPEPRGRTSTCRVVPSHRQTCSKVSGIFYSLVLKIHVFFFYWVS